MASNETTLWLGVLKTLTDPIVETTMLHICEDVFKQVLILPSVYSVIIFCIQLRFFPNKEPAVQNLFSIQCSVASEGSKTLGNVLLKFLWCFSKDFFIIKVSTTNTQHATFHLSSVTKVHFVMQLSQRTDHMGVISFTDKWVSDITINQ